MLIIKPASKTLNSKNIIFSAKYHLFRQKIRFSAIFKNQAKNSKLFSFFLLCLYRFWYKLFLVFNQPGDKTMQHIYGFTASNGVHFIAVRTEKEGKAVIAFYDARFPQCQRDNIPAQFVSRYYVETLAQHEGGLNLEGSEPEWKIDSASFQAVKKHLIGA